MKATKLAGVLGALLFGGAVSNANAGAWTISPDPATIGTAAGSVSQPITISYTGDGATQDAQIDYDFNEALFTAQPAAVNNGGCQVVTIGGNQFLRVTSSTGSNIPSTPTAFCNVTFTSLTANADIVPPPGAEHSFPASNAVCGDAVGAPTTCTPSGPIRLDVQAAPVAQAPTLTFNPPAPGPVALSNAGTGSIGVTASTGTTGTSTTLACTASTGFTATPVPASYTSAGGTGTVNLTCTPNTTAAQTGTVSCNPTQSAGTDQPAQVFNVTCPLLTAPPPEFTAPLSLALVGAPSTTATGSITVQNTGGSPLTITCGAPTAGFTVTSGPTSPVPAGGSTSIGISCATPGAAGATTNGTLACTTNDTDEAAVTFALSCTSQILSVPALGNTAKGMLIALLAGLGLFGFAMRRRLV